MVAQVHDPAAARRRLRLEIRRLRLEADLTQKDVADKLEWSPSKVIRIENGSVGVSVTDLQAVLGLLDPAARVDVEEFKELARASRKQPWQQYRDVYPAESLQFFGFESAASLIRSFEPQVLPGLLQTREYAQALLRDAFGNEGQRAERKIEARLERQELFSRDSPPKTFFVIDEAVLRRAVGGPKVMAAQCDHLLRLAAKDQVSIQVIPFSAGAQAGLRGPFCVLSFSDDVDDLLYLENRRDQLEIEDQVEVGVHVETFIGLEAIASPSNRLSEVIDTILSGGALPSAW